jgi:putative ABC transport system permease protein
VLRSLTHFWRLHLAVLLGAAITATVLTGSLAVGDSMRASLRRLWLERLGDVELAAQAPRFFRAGLADETARRLHGATVAPLIVLRGTAEHAGSRRRAARIAVLGIDRRFAALYPGEGAAPGPPAAGTGGRPAVSERRAAAPTMASGLPAAGDAGEGGGAPGLPRLAINETLARRLGARSGDDVLLSWEQPSAIPREMLLAAKDPGALLATHRFTVGAVVSDRGAGSFDLAPGQATPANAFLPLAELQHELGLDGRANTLLIGRLPAGTGAAAAATAALAAGLRLDDLGLTLRPLGGTGGGGGTDGGGIGGGGTGDAGERRCGLALESRDFFLPPPAADGALAAAGELGVAAQPVLTYLAIDLAAHGRAVPYSLVSALGPATVPAAGPSAGPAAGPSAGPAAGPRAGLAAGPRAGLAVGPRAGLAAGPSAVQAAGTSAVQAAGPRAGPAAGPRAVHVPGPSAAAVAGQGAAQATAEATAAAAEATGGLLLAGGGVAPVPAGDEMLLDSWAADDLAARPGDTIEMSYFLPETGSGAAPLRIGRASFRLSGVVALAGLAADRGLTPAFPGIDQARDMAAWSPPFPVDLHRVRPRDEAYWHRYGPTPKAFVSLAAGRRRWTTRFGDLTSLRLACPAGAGPAELAARFAPRLLARLRPEAFGLALRPVRAEGLRAAAEGTDFSSLFVSFSSFLIVAAAMVSGLLFTLGLERRAREAGLLLALGYPPGAVRRRFLGEGLVLAGAGALLGVGGAGLYTAALLGGLQKAAGTPRLAFAAGPSTLAWGWIASVATVLVFLAAGLRRIRRLPAAQLLAGAVTAGRGRSRARFWRWLAAAAAAAVLVLAAALHAERGGAPTLAFGVAAGVLAAGISGFALWCLAAGERREASGGLLAMGVRNTAANSNRSVLCVALVACACLALVLVAANRRRGVAGERTTWGGFDLVAESATPLYQDLGRPEGRAALDFPPAAERLLAGSEILGLSEVPGDDASCLNLYRPRRPRLLGVPPPLADRLRTLLSGGGVSSAGFGNLGGLEGLPPRAGGNGRRGAGSVDGGRGENAVVPAIGDEESVRWNLHLGVGDEMTVEGAGDAPVRLRIAGLLDGSPLQDALLIPERELASHFPRHGGRSFFLVRTPPGREAEVAALLADQLRGFGFAIEPVAERLRLYAGVQDTYLASFQALGSLGLLLGTAGLGVVLLRNVVERRWELAVLRAFGFRRRRLAGLLLLENATLLGLGVVLGTVAGLLPEALGAGVAGSFPWRPLAATLAAVLTAGMLASCAAVAIALGAPLLPVLKADR